MSDLRPSVAAVQERLQQLARAGGPVPAFLEALSEALSLLQFRAVLAFVGPLLFRGGGKADAAAPADTPDEAQSLQLVTDALLRLDSTGQQAEPPPASTMCHLLLQTLPAQASPENAARFKPAAVQLFSRYCQMPDGARLAVRVAAAFQLHREDLGEQVWSALESYVQQLLQDRSGYSPAVRLLMHFEGLDACLDKEALLAKMVEEGQEALAETWAGTLGQECKVAFIEACLLHERTRSAAHAVRKWDMHEQYPDVDVAHRTRMLTRLLSKRLWAVAQSYAGSDEALQMLVLREMQLAGAAALASDFATHWGLEPHALGITAESLAEEAARRREEYLEPALPAEAVVFVSCREGLRAAQGTLAGARVVGFDVEWKPNHETGGTSKASLLQVATSDQVLLFDLIVLASSHASELDEVLEPLMTSSATLKLGFGPNEDLGKLAGSWPHIQAFRRPANVLDLRYLWHAYAGQGPIPNQLRVRGVGLSAVSKALLGKPLDKSMQMSDWEARPLSARQQEYAALDAHVLLQCYDALSAALGRERVDKLAATHAYAYQVKPTRGSGWRREQRTAADEDSGSDDDDDRGSDSMAHVSDTGNGHMPQEHPLPAQAPPALSGQGVAEEGQWQNVVAVLEERGLGRAFQWLSSWGRQGCLATASSAASTLNVTQARIAKSVAVLGREDERYVVVTCGDQRIHLRKLAQELGVSRKALRIASGEECIQLFGYRPGTMPPFGHAAGIKVIVDWRLDPARSLASTSTDDAHAEAMAASPQPGPEEPCSSYAAVTGRADSGWGTSASCVSHVQQNGTALDQTSSHGEAGVVYCGSGSKDALVVLRFQQLVELSGGRVADVAAAEVDEGGTGGSVVAKQGAQGALAGPSSTSSDSAGAQAPAVQLRFLVDGMLGRLCRWLRCLGIDAEFVGKHPGVPELAQMASEAARQGRMFLTRDARLAARRDCWGAFVLSSDAPEEQLAEVSAHFGITFNDNNVLSRCSMCNASAFQLLPPGGAAGRVPDRILAMVEEFWECSNCQKVFWMGPKSYAAMSLVERLLKGGSHQEADRDEQQQDAECM